MIWLRLAICVIVFSAALVAGCAIHPVYPPSWPADKVKSPDCRNIAGLYKNTGNDHSGRDVKLEWTLLPQVHIPSYFTDFISIAWDDDIFKVSAIKQGARLPEASYSYGKHEYQCTESGLVLRSSHVSRNESSLGVHLYSSAEYTLFRVRDGSLIVKGSSSDFGLLLLVIPIYISGDDWGRYLPVPAEVPAP